MDRSPTRTYTYRQIDEASNTIANYLHDAGITNGDVVMIFAHRSVELVCAFMGTLVRLILLKFLYDLIVEPPAVEHD